MTEEKNKLKDELQKILGGNNFSKLKTWYYENEDKSTFLEKYNSWQREEGKELINRFIASHQTDAKFSWLEIDDKFKIEDFENSPANLHYGVPSQFSGDIDNANLFICLTNPNIEIADGFRINKHPKGYHPVKNVKGYYDKIQDESFQDESLQPDFLKDENKITNYIYCSEYEGSIVDRELTNIKNRKNSHYYHDKYYHHLLETDDYTTDNLELSICNLEAFPFRSKNPAAGQTGDGRTILDTKSDVVLLSSRIILRRIVRYLFEDDSVTKPVFCFRRFDDAYKESLKSVIKEIIENDEQLDNNTFNSIMTILDKYLFYHFGKKDLRMPSSASLSLGGLKKYIGDNMEPIPPSEYEKLKESVHQVTKY